MQLSPKIPPPPPLPLNHLNILWKRMFLFYLERKYLFWRSPAAAGGRPCFKRKPGLLKVTHCMLRTMTNHKVILSTTNITQPETRHQPAGGSVRTGFIRPSGLTRPSRGLTRGDRRGQATRRWPRRYRTTSSTRGEAPKTTTKGTAPRTVMWRAAPKTPSSMPPSPPS